MIGQTISHYKILDKLGEGGMGVVYKAEDERLRRTVALKFLPNRSESEDDRARFEREAQAAAALDHPNICTIYEIDHVDGQTFLAMQLLEGETLDQRIGSGPVPLGEALNIVCQAAEGLAAAHEKGVVHRDIKSANLMLIKRATGGVQVKLMDFGLAQLAGRSKLTQAASILGTIAYMSPEQTQGEAVDQRTDVWALGVVLYEMVAGELPFKGHYDQATMYSILNEPAEPLTAVRSRLPMDLDWIADKCLAKEPSARYQSMGDLLIDLRNLERKLSGGQTQIRQPGAAPAAAAAVAPVAQAQPEIEVQPGDHRRVGRCRGRADAERLAGLGARGLRRAESEPAPFRNHPSPDDPARHARPRFGDCPRRRQAGVDSPSRGRSAVDQTSRPVRILGGRRDRRGVESVLVARQPADRIPRRPADPHRLGAGRTVKRRLRARRTAVCQRGLEP